MSLEGTWEMSVNLTSEIYSLSKCPGNHLDRKNSYTMALAFFGLKVIDFTQVLAGPHASQLLAMWIISDILVSRAVFFFR